ncbi:MAG: hypothetical protein ACYTHM_01155 [Planctomycetota bacterium]|jgi:hypothetical protein
MRCPGCILPVLFALGLNGCLDELRQIGKTLPAYENPELHLLGAYTRDPPDAYTFGVIVRLLVEELGAAEYARRERAEKRLIQLGHRILPHIERMVTEDMEIEFRLKRIQRFVFGPKTVKRFSRMCKRFFEDRTEFAGEYYVDTIEKIKIQRVHPKRVDVHLRFRYKSLDIHDNEIYTEERVFHFEGEMGREWVTGMGEENSAKFD